MSARTAQDVMTRDVTTIALETSVEDLIRVIKDERYSGLPVVDAGGKVVGFVSQTDVLGAVAHLIDREQLPESFHSDKRRASAALLEVARTTGVAVALGTFLKRDLHQVMTPAPVTCAPDTPLAEVCELMLSRRVHRIIVVDAMGLPLGLVSTSDLVRAFERSLRA